MGCKPQCLFFEKWKCATFAADMRKEDGACGPDAKLYRPRQSPWTNPHRRNPVEKMDRRGGRRATPSSEQKEQQHG